MVQAFPVSILSRENGVVIFLAKVSVMQSAFKSNCPDAAGASAGVGMPSGACIPRAIR